MTRKDWGGTAFKVTCENGAYTVKEVAVHKRGNQYITLAWKERFYIETGRPVETWRGEMLLFPTREAADDYVQRVPVLNDVCRFLNYEGRQKAQQMTTLQLERLRGLFGEVK